MNTQTQVRCPVHDFIALGKRECQIINTKVVQRLRGIHQLAMAYLVYPGALHNRFDHSLGVYHLSSKLCDRLQINNDDKRLVQFAAILHDIGHGPFSHVWENGLSRYSDKVALGIKREKIHERIGQDMIAVDPELNRCLSTDERNSIISLLRDGYGEPVLKDIVSGPLDADKQDYLLRDSRFCGVPYGTFDLSQLHRCLATGEQDGSTCLAVTEDGVHTLEQFVLAKYYLTNNVYRHKVRLISDNMLTRAVMLGIETDGIEELRELCSYDGKNPEQFIREYALWDDARFLVTFGSDRYNGTKCHTLVTRLRERQLLKQVYCKQLSESEFPDGLVREALTKLQEAQQTEIEEQIAGALAAKWGKSIDSKLVTVSVYSVRSVRTDSKDDEKSILIGSPKPVPFEECSLLFNSINEQLSYFYVEVYAPADWTSRTKRREMMDGVSADIYSILNSVTQVKGAVE